MFSFMGYRNSSRDQSVPEIGLNSWINDPYISFWNSCTFHWGNSNLFKVNNKSRSVHGHISSEVVVDC